MKGGVMPKFTARGWKKLVVAALIGTLSFPIGFVIGDLSRTQAAVYDPAVVLLAVAFYLTIQTCRSERRHSH